MITRLVSLLLLGSSLLVPALAPAAGTIQLIVESYDYTPGKATNTWGYGVANNGTLVGEYNHKANAGSFTRTSKGRFSHPILFPGAVTTDRPALTVPVSSAGRLTWTKGSLSLMASFLTVPPTPSSTYPTPSTPT